MQDRLRNNFRSKTYGNSLLIHADCMDVMKYIKDKEISLACVDPPYGIGEDGKSNHSRGAGATQFLVKDWDKKTESPEYFRKLFSISKNQIIWGANHFINLIPHNSPCWIVWDKDNGNSDFADCELAWTSFKTAVRKFTFTWDGFRQGDSKNKEKRTHPCQKPAKLYEWLLLRYAKKGDIILDTHAGSFSSAIAAYNSGFEYVGIEKDEDYFNMACDRMDEHVKQIRLFESI